MTEAATDADLGAKSLPQLFDVLAPIAPPPEVSMLPETPIWGLLAGLACVGLGLGVALAVRYYRANAYRRAGCAALALAGDNPVEIATVLRRTALAAFPRVEVAGLHGPDWAAFLDATGPQAGFSKGACATILEEAPYRALPPAPGLAKKADIWIRTHRTAPRTATLRQLQGSTSGMAS